MDEEQKWQDFLDKEWKTFQDNDDVVPRAVSMRILRRLRKSLGISHGFVYKPKLQPSLLRMAAAAAVLLSIGGIYFIEIMSQNAEVVVANTLQFPCKVILPDSTILWLEQQSEIRYAKTWRQNEERKLALKGGATFYVRQVAGSPFEVTTKDLKVHVLGTTFYMNDGNETEGGVVGLISGRVSVTSRYRANMTASPLLLSPGMLLQLDKKSTDGVKLMNVDKSISSKWDLGQITFDDIEMTAAIKLLQDMYGIPITVYTGRILKVAGKFRRDQPLEETLHMIAYVNNLSLQKSDKGYMLADK